MTRKTKRKFYSIFMLTTLLVSLLLAVFQPMKQANADNNVATWIMCRTDDGKILYNAATTDLVPYAIRSKSNIAKTQRMDGFLNSVLGVSGFKFDEVNTAILGRPINDRGKTEDEEEAKKEDNKKEDEDGSENPNASAPKVTPFDRFGVAGLSFSSYAGEWKYYETDGCADGKEASPVEFGKFYEDRKEPKATFNEIPQSTDPRVQQYNKGVFSAWSASLNDMITNGLFSITKVIVTFTIALVGLSFVDLTEIIGFGDASIGGMTGMFTNLYNGVFMPFIMIAVIMMTLYIMYYGLIKRQVRKALVNGLATTVLCMLLAAVIANNPAFWLPIPNNIATLGQSVVITALGQSTDETSGLCGNNIAGLKTDNVNMNSSVDQQKEQMKAVGENMKSTIGCRMWEEFLLKPWTRGQFGVEYDELNAGGTKNGKVENINGEWVGAADVPLGGDVIAHNWALFHLSTQTEVHAQLSKELTATNPEENQLRLVDGLSSDWWRVVDAFSNYDEKEEKSTPPGSIKEITLTKQVVNKPLPEWQSWIGNHPQQRYSTAFLSILFGGVGSLGPLVFGMLSAVYSAGVTLLMATSPIFLLLACFPGRGQTFFKGWLEALVSTMVKKIICAGLLLVSFAVTVNAMDMINEIGWIKAFMLLLVMTFVIIRSRHKIFNTIAKFNFGGIFRPDQAFKAYSDKKQKQAKTGSDIGLSGVAGAMEAKKAGMNMADGFATGAGYQFNQTMRRNQGGRAYLSQYNQATGVQDTRCSICNQIAKGYAYLDEDGNVVCRNCAEDYAMEHELNKFEIPKDNSSIKTVANKKRIKKINKQRLSTRGYSLFQKAPNAGMPYKTAEMQDRLKSPNSYLSYSKSIELANIERDEDGNVYWDNAEVENMIKKNLVGLEQDIADYDMLYTQNGAMVMPPSAPEPIQKYIPDTALSEAWRMGRYDVVREAYKEGWKEWYEDNADSVNNVDKKEYFATIEAIDTTNAGEIAQYIEEKRDVVQGYENVPVYQVIQDMEDEKMGYTLEQKLAESQAAQAEKKAEEERIATEKRRKEVSKKNRKVTNEMMSRIGKNGATQPTPTGTGVEPTENVTINRTHNTNNVINENNSEDNVDEIYGNGSNSVKPNRRNVGNNNPDDSVDENNEYNDNSGESSPTNNFNPDKVNKGNNRVQPTATKSTKGNTASDELNAKSVEDLKDNEDVSKVDDNKDSIQTEKPVSSFGAFFGKKSRANADNENKESKDDINAQIEDDIKKEDDSDKPTRSQDDKTSRSQAEKVTKDSKSTKVDDVKDTKEPSVTEQPTDRRRNNLEESRILERTKFNERELPKKEYKKKDRKKAKAEAEKLNKFNQDKYNKELEEANKVRLANEKAIKDAKAARKKAHEEGTGEKILVPKLEEVKEPEAPTKIKPKIQTKKAYKNEKKAVKRQNAQDVRDEKRLDKRDERVDNAPKPVAYGQSRVKKVRDDESTLEKVKNFKLPKLGKGGSDEPTKPTRRRNKIDRDEE